MQVVLLPIADRHEAYALDLDRTLKAAGIRSQVDFSREKVNKKIREAELQKIPMILVIGDKEVANGTASLRVHSAGDKGEIVIAEFMDKVRELVRNRSLTVNF